MWPGQRGDGFWDELLPYYRIAAANGDYKANVRLQFLLSDGWTKVPYIEAEAETQKLYKMLHKQLPATAYYLLKGYIEDGYGVSAPPTVSWHFCVRLRIWAAGRRNMHWRKK